MGMRVKKIKDKYRLVEKGYDGEDSPCMEYKDEEFKEVDGGGYSSEGEAAAYIAQEASRKSRMGYNQ